MKKIKSQDEVIVIAGKDKGKRGKVLRLTTDGRVFVSGVNMIKKHTKPNPMAGQAGGIVEKEAPIAISNIAIYNSETGKADRVGLKVEPSTGVKQRVYKSNNQVIGG